MDLRVAPHVCALHDVSPRDRWLCVLPGGQMNVNVNVNAKCRLTPTVKRL